MKLTDEKIQSIWMHTATFDAHLHDIIAFARAILKEAWVEELERDAERYRWLCRQTYGCDPEPFRLLDDFDSDKQSIDTAIDEAMKAK